MTRAQASLFAVVLASACEAPTLGASVLAPERYVVELSVTFASTIFGTQTYDRSPRDERPQVIEPYQLGWLEVLSTTTPTPPGWQLSLDQVVLVPTSTPAARPAIVAYPGRSQTLTQRLLLPGYVCLRWRGLPSAEYEFLSVAATSTCRAVPEPFDDASFERVQRSLPNNDAPYRIDAPFIIDIATVRSAFASEEASNFDGWDQTYVGPEGETPSYY